MELTDRLAGRFREASRPGPLIPDPAARILSFFAYAILLPPSLCPSSNFLGGGGCPIEPVVPVCAHRASQGLQVAGQGLQLAAIVISFVLGLAEQLRIAGSSICEICKLNREDLKLREGGLEPSSGPGHRPGSRLGWEIYMISGKPGKWGRPQGFHPIFSAFYSLYRWHCFDQSTRHTVDTVTQDID